MRRPVRLSMPRLQIHISPHMTYRHDVHHYRAFHALGRVERRAVRNTGTAVVADQYYWASLPEVDIGEGQDVLSPCAFGVRCACGGGDGLRAVAVADKGRSWISKFEFRCLSR